MIDLLRNHNRKEPIIIKSTPAKVNYVKKDKPPTLPDTPVSRVLGSVFVKDGQRYRVLAMALSFIIGTREDSQTPLLEDDLITIDTPQ